MLRATPRGFRDVLPDEALRREALADEVRRTFAEAGYVPVETPLLERASVLEQAGPLKGVPFKLFDSDDQLLMVRPELTLPIARMVATRLGGSGAPLRLRYQGPVVREQRSGHGLPRQFTQMGVELIGGEDGGAEVEVIDLLARVLDRVDVVDWTLSVGSVRPLQALLADPSVSPALAASVRECVHRTDLVALDELLADAGLPDALAQAISRVCRLHGGVEVLGELAALLEAAGIDAERAGVGELEALAGSLGEAARRALTIDLSLAGSFDYYTGIIFKAYAPGLVGSLASGGRYDSVLDGSSAGGPCAMGFALSLERLLESFEPRAPEAGRVRIAVPKGALFEGALRVLERAGLPTEGLARAGRHLLVREDEVDYLIVRATDAPTFVAYGGADLGICGTDSLAEAALDLMVLKDLNYGHCRFVVAEPAARAGSVDAAIAQGAPLVVATKYPRIAEAHFASQGVAADVVELHGNIELAPLVAMADCIVDITATGTTLRENHLSEVREVSRCSARLFASQAAYRASSRVRELADAIARAKIE